MTLSSAEAEYVALVPACQEVMWFKILLAELGYPQACVELFEDNVACIALTKNPQNRKQTRHIQTKYHFSRNLVNSGEIKLTHCSTNSQLADIFTKGVDRLTLQKHCNTLGITTVS